MRSLARKVRLDPFTYSMVLVNAGTGDTYHVRPSMEYAWPPLAVQGPEAAPPS